MKITKNNQFGRSMIEMLGVLAIIGVLSIGGIAGYSKAMEKHKINKTIDEINTLTGNLRPLINNKLNASCSQSDAGLCPILKKLNIVPDYMWQEDGLLKNSFGGDVDILVGIAKSMRIVYTGIPYPACIQLATSNWGNTDLAYLSIISTDKLGYGYETILFSKSKTAEIESVFGKEIFEEIGNTEIGNTDYYQWFPINIQQASQLCKTFNDFNFYLF